MLLLPIDADETFKELDKVADGELAFRLYDSQDHTQEHLVTSSNLVQADRTNGDLSARSRSSGRLGLGYSSSALHHF